MNELFPREKYCFDSSAFIDNWRRYYWPANFPGLWKSIGEMMDGGIIICPELVWQEIKDGDDDLTEWFENHLTAVIPMEGDQLNKVQELLSAFPKMADYNRPRPHHADPFVVALAEVKEIPVITMESGGDQNNPKIPYVCTQRGAVPAKNFSRFISEQGWVFNQQ